MRKKRTLSFTILTLAYLATTPVIAQDFSGDGVVDVLDKDIVVVGCRFLTFAQAPEFDLNGDGVLNHLDLDQFLANAAKMNGLSQPYKNADVNMDGFVDGSDWLIWNANKFSMTLMLPSDANLNMLGNVANQGVADFYVDVSDLNIILQDLWTSSW